MEGVAGLRFKGTVRSPGEVMTLRQMAILCPQSGSREKERGCSPSSFLFISRPQAMGQEPPTLRMGLPTSVNPLFMIPDGHAQSLVT